MWLKLRLIVLVAAAAFIALTGTAQGPPPQFITLPGVDLAQMERCDNLKLFLPDGAPTVSVEQAQATAEAADPFDLPVQQAVLAKLVRDGPPELVYRDNLVWVFVLGDGSVREIHVSRPIGDEEYYQPASYTYSLVLIDALTGEFVHQRFGPENPAYVANICPP